ncbi:MAG: hypothetical protein J5828_05650 [Desulfovibrionaceae bacterium]|nr:hypothetical protein [Desulfovibrionaceae bacterium]MBO4793237.1 hypothetical protein [Deltaproteobacteria bacterium]
MKKFTLLLLILLLGLALPACGKKDNPRPKDQEKLFAWKAAKGVLFSGTRDKAPVRCLAVTADLTGAAHNVERFLLEIEPQTENVCKGCPFMPEEIITVTPQRVQTAGNTTRLSFEACPAQSAPAYRWRLVAQSLFKSVPHVFSKIYFADSEK